MPSKQKQTKSEEKCPKCPRLDEIYDSVLDTIGNTPMIRLNRIGSDLPCELLAKCEFFNPGGSVKDRIALRMLDEAEKSGRVKPGDTLIEPTSGNTGIGESLCCAVRGYRCIITMPEKMSKEKVDVLKALGSEIIRTPTEAAFDAPDSHISVAKRLNEEITDSHILDQYSNPDNPGAHYKTTAEEIIRQCGGKVDMLVAGAGTGGTITGIAKRLKEHNPDVIIVGVDPQGSILAVPENLNDKNRLEPYQVEGIGYDFIPNVLDRSLIDEWYKSNDKDSLLMMRKLIRQEGLLVGGSAGSAVCGALHAARSLKAGQRCVIILPDSVRNYMSKALSDDWMGDHGFVDGDIIKAKDYQSWWATKKVYDMPINTPLTITSDVSCKEAISLLKQEGFDMVPVLDDGDVVGVVTEGNMINQILRGRCTPETSIKEAGVIYKTFHKFSMNDSLGKLAQALDHDPFALVVTEQRCFSVGKKRKTGGTSEDGNTDPSSDNSAKAKLMTRIVVSGIVSRIDLLDFISHGKADHLDE
jgi:cystathionine beta-synthase